MNDQNVDTANLSVLVTGAGGYVGGETVKVLCQEYNFKEVVATDIREKPAHLEGLNLTYYKGDIRDLDQMTEIIKNHQVDVVLHLAAALPSKNGLNADFEYSVNVTGTENMLKACIANGCKKIIITSSGSAYGYHADNAEVIDEDHPLRGNEEFPYSKQKKQVEDLLAKYRVDHPELKQVIFRLSATIGSNVKNQISDFFEKPVVIGIKNNPCPFVFIWDRDVVNCLIQATVTDKEGIFNLSADGSVPLKDIAKIMKKPYVPVSSGFFYNAIKFLRKVNLTQYGPEQVSFLLYRPILSNKRLKEEFGYIPQKNSKEVFLTYVQNRS
jgi:UDP-glucose 4-epimerase